MKCFSGCLLLHYSKVIEYLRGDVPGNSVVNGTRTGFQVTYQFNENQEGTHVI
jgi:hypothetical protein